MNFEEWEAWKEQTIRRYKVDDILLNDGLDFNFKLGGYGFRFKFRYLKVPGFERGVMNAQYCFLHIGAWNDMYTNNEIETKLSLAYGDSSKSDTFLDIHSNKSKVIKRAEKTERKIEFKRR